MLLSIRDKGVVRVKSFTELTVNEKSIEEAAKSGKTTTDMDLRTGEIEINIEGGVFTGSLQVHTPNAVAGVRGTHFWVFYNKDKSLTAVGVYKGKVEVKSNDGKTTDVSPHGDKSGVILVSQKISAIKLFLAGLVLVGIVGGAVWHIKKRELKTPSRKK